MKNKIKLNGKKYLIPNLKKHSVFDYVKLIKASSGAVLGYEVLFNVAYFSKRYRKYITVEAKDISDGATTAPDIDSFSWLFHDEVCEEGAFNDGTKATNWQASKILSDILSEEGKWFRAKTWFAATWLFGGGKARKNGML